MLVEVYSDVACPWCYVGERRFAKALSKFGGRDDVTVVYRPFQLDPSASPTATPLGAALARKFGPRAGELMANVTAAAADEGIAMRQDIALSVNTFEAHRLMRFAEHEYGPAVQRAVAERLFDAYFTRGVDVGDHAALADLAEDAGIDRARAAAYLASSAGTAELRAELDDARAFGITAVPTFVFEQKYAVSGAQAPELFLQALEQVALEVAEAGPPQAGLDATACSDEECDV